MLALDFVAGADDAPRRPARGRGGPGWDWLPGGAGGGGMTRAAEIGEFLAREGWGWAERAPLAGDASARRYERLSRGGARDARS